MAATEIPAASDRPPYRHILVRVGVVLIAIGLMDIAWMVHVIRQGQAYSSSFNIFAVIAGLFFVCGNLRAARIVREFLGFFLFLPVALAGYLLFVQPLSLTFVEVKLNIVSVVGWSAVGLAFFLVLYWIFRELKSEPIVAAQLAAGITRRRRTRRILDVICFLLFPLLIGWAFFGNQAERRHAVELAHSQIGADFRYFVSSLSIHWDSSCGTEVDGTVTAWKSDEVKQLPVHWTEDRPAGAQCCDKPDKPQRSSGNCHGF